jgi:hypothetical protein
MNALTEDISKVVSLLEYEAEISNSLQVTVAQGLLNRFAINEWSFGIALKKLLTYEPSLKLVYEYSYGDPKGDEGQIEFFIVVLPKDFKKNIVPKYTYEPGVRFSKGRRLKVNPETSEPLISSKYFSLYSDGTLKFATKTIRLRYQLKELFYLFLEKPNKLLTFDEIKENVISSDKNAEISNTTISKYVSELRASVKKLVGKNIIRSVPNDGWVLETDP